MPDAVVLAPFIVKSIATGGAVLAMKVMGACIVGGTIVCGGIYGTLTIKNMYKVYVSSGKSNKLVKKSLGMDGCLSESLHIKEAGFTDETLSILSEGFKKHTHITPKIDISIVKCALSKDQLEKINMHGSDRIKLLNLSDNCLEKAEDIKALLKTIHGCKIEKLDLSLNKFESEEAFDELFSGLNSEKIKCIDISDTYSAPLNSVLSTIKYNLKKVKDEDRALEQIILKGFCKDKNNRFEKTIEKLFKLGVNSVLTDWGKYSKPKNIQIPNDKSVVFYQKEDTLKSSIRFKQNATLRKTSKTKKNNNIN